MKNDWDDAAEQSPYPELGGALAKTERCEPDYEGMIKNERDKREALSFFYEATKSFKFSQHSGAVNRSNLRDLLGVLHVRILECDAAISGLIRNQEKAASGKNA